MVAQVDAAYRKAGLSRTLVRLASYALFEGRPLTTRGRWFNPVVLGLASTLAKLGPDDAVSKPVFIVGNGRSGTTLLGKILSLHHAVGYLNEPKALWYRACPYEDVIGSYAATPGRYALTAADATPAIVERFRRIYGGYLRLVRRSRVVDKYPEAVFRVPFVRQVFPDARFIWIVRNGHDTVASIAAWNRAAKARGGAQADNWWGRDDRKWIALVEQVCVAHESLAGREQALLALDSDTDRAALEWATSTLQGIAVARDAPDVVLSLRYEELVSQPGDGIAAVLGFCDLDQDAAALSYARQEVRARTRDHARESLSPLVAGIFEQAMDAAGYS